MALPLAKKKEHVAELKEKFETNQWCLLADPIGLTVAEVTDLRVKLREKGVDYKIYKNTLIRKAIEETGNEALKPLIKNLKGPTGMAFTGEDPIVAAKVFADFAAAKDTLEIKAAMFQGQYWDAGKTKEMAKLGSLGTIYGQLVMAMKTPMYKLTNALNYPLTELVMTLKAVADKGDNK